MSSQKEQDKKKKKRQSILEAELFRIMEKSLKAAMVLAPGGISHSGPGGNRQLWPDENSQS